VETVSSKGLRWITTRTRRPRAFETCRRAGCCAKNRPRLRPWWSLPRHGPARFIAWSGAIPSVGRPI